MRALERGESFHIRFDQFAKPTFLFRAVLVHADMRHLRRVTERVHERSVCVIPRLCTCDVDALFEKRDGILGAFSVIAPRTTRNDVPFLVSKFVVHSIDSTELSFGHVAAVDARGFHDLHHARFGNRYRDVLGTSTFEILQNPMVDITLERLQDGRCMSFVIRFTTFTTRFALFSGCIFHPKLGCIEFAKTPDASHIPIGRGCVS